MVQVKSMIEWQPVILSIKVASISVIFVFLFGVLAAYVMKMVDIPGKAVLESLFTLPLVLPPVVIGFLLLFLVGKRGPVGILLTKYFDMQIIFTQSAAVLAGTVVSFPLMYQSIKTAFEGIDKALEDASRTLGANEWRVFWTVTMPLSWSGLVSGLVLSFARTLGEFGATIMVAGNILGKTQTIPLAIYFATESNDLVTAGMYVVIISVITFSIIFGLNYWKGKKVLV